MDQSMKVNTLKERIKLFFYSYLILRDGRVTGRVSLLVDGSLFRLTSIVVLRLGLVHFGQQLCPRFLSLFKRVIHFFPLF